MSDLFHELIPDTFLDQVFDTMINTPRHAYQILTKRPERAAKWPGPWMPHIWLGTSVENRHELHRIGTLQHSQAQRRFLSLEPLLEDLGPLDLSGIHWVIVGGESGKIHRPMDHAWARAIRDQCIARGIPLWFKQSAARYSEQDIFLQEADGSARIWRYMPTWNDRL
jgi:protein gp37